MHFVLSCVQRRCMFLFQVLFIGSWGCKIWLQLLPDASISVKNTSILSLNMLFWNTPGKVKKIRQQVQA